MKTIEVILFGILGGCIGIIVAYSNSPVISIVISSFLTLISGLISVLYNRKSVSKFTVEFSQLLYLTTFILTFTICGISTLKYKNHLYKKQNSLDFNEYQKDLILLFNQRSKLSAIIKRNADDSIKNSMVDSLRILEHLFEVKYSSKVSILDSILINSNKTSNIRLNNPPISKINLSNEKPLSEGFLNGAGVKICDIISEIRSIDDLRQFANNKRIIQFIDTCKNPQPKTISSFLIKYCENTKP